MLVKPSGLLLLDVFILSQFSWEMQQKCSWSGTRCKWCTSLGIEKRSRAIWGLRQCTHHNGGGWSRFLCFNFRRCACGVFSSSQWLSPERVCWWVRCCLICPLRQLSQLLRLSDWTEAWRPGKAKTASDKLAPTAGDRLSLQSCSSKDASVILSIFTPPTCLGWTAHLFPNLCQMFYVLMSMRRAEASIKHASDILINVFSRLFNLARLFRPPVNKL